MKHRIRAAAIIIKDEKVLLVKHVHPVSGFTWWVPPGGGLESEDESIIACAKREVFEETGLMVNLEEDPRFIREFYDEEHETLNLELFFTGAAESGELTIENIHGKGEDEKYIKEVAWVSLDEIQNITVFPEVLKDNFGRDEEGIYLGRQ